MHIASIGIDIGKTTFDLVALDAQGTIVVRRKFSRPWSRVPHLYRPNLAIGWGRFLPIATSPS